MDLLTFFSGFFLRRRRKAALPSTPPSDDELAALFVAKVFTKPVGYWRCTHAAPWAERAGFVPGQTYLCWQDAAGSYRIKPRIDSSWGPYWIPEDGRFCYPDSDMRFTYVGINA